MQRHLAQSGASVARIARAIAGARCGKQQTAGFAATAAAVVVGD